MNNAGRAPRLRADIMDATEESFEEVVRTNLQGPYFLTQAIARDMLERARPGLIPRGHRVRHIRIRTDDSTNRGEYCISKAGLAMAAICSPFDWLRTASRSTTCGQASSPPT